MNTSKLRRNWSAAIANGCAIGWALALGAGSASAAPPAGDTMTVVDSRAERPVVADVRSAPCYAETRSVRVRYGDLDLSRDASVDTLYARLIRASQAVCAPRYTRIAAERADWRRCQHSALDEAVAATGLQRVVEVHRHRSGRDVARSAELVAATR